MPEVPRMATSRLKMTDQDVDKIYQQSPTIVELRRMLVTDSGLYTAEEFGMFLAMPNNKIWGGRNVFKMIHENRDDECLSLARSLIEGAYT
jgi:hypothetical protein